MTKLIVCLIVLIIAGVYAAVQWWKGNTMAMWLGVFIIIITLSIGVPEAMRLATDYANDKSKDFFEKLTP